MYRIVVLILASLIFDASVPAAQAPAPAGVCTDQSKLPADKRITNKVSWVTASESENFGYDVYRGESADGKFIKLTKQPILGAGTTYETHQYKFIDETLNPCKDYWYYVESITTQGGREKFTPVFKRPAKLNTDGSPVAAPSTDKAH